MAAVDSSGRHTTMVSQPSFEPDATYQVLPLMGSSATTKKLFTDSVLEIGSSRSSSSTLSSSKAVPGLYITGLGSQYPPFLLHPDRLGGFISRWYDLETPGIKKLLAINQTTTIQTRSTIKHPDDPFWNPSNAPSISELDGIFREAGVDLTVQACQKALRDANVGPESITHIVAVTCTNTGNPGFDLLVSQKLKLKAETDRTLLHGVGCAGGLSAMRAAAAMAQSASMRGRAARVLVFACEICSIHVRCDLEEVVEHAEKLKISPVLFSDGAAAFVLCNELASEAENQAVYSLINWETATMPETSKELEFLADPLGFRATLTKEVPKLAVKAIGPMFEKLRHFLPTDSQLAASGRLPEAKDFDWALHPGGIAILNGVQNRFELKEDQLRASYNVYEGHGNSSSPTVLVVLDQLRKKGKGRENVMACSFGPGMTIEMAMLKRCVREEEE